MQRPQSLSCCALSDCRGHGRDDPATVPLLCSSSAMPTVGSTVLVGKRSAEDLFRDGMDLGMGRGGDVDVIEAERCLTRAAGMGRLEARAALC